jgi:hypothetical protein
MRFFNRLKYSKLSFLQGLNIGTKGEKMRFFVFSTGTKSLKKYLLLGLYLGPETPLLDLKIFKILEFRFVLFGPKNRVFGPR